MSIVYLVFILVGTHRYTVQEVLATEPRPLSSPAPAIARNPPGKAVWFKVGGGGGVKQNNHELFTPYTKNIPEVTVNFLKLKFLPK